MKYAPLELSDQDSSMILAALRLWQDVYQVTNVKPEFNDIATNGGIHELMTSDGIDALCEDVNCGRKLIQDVDQAMDLNTVRDLRKELHQVNVGVLCQQELAESIIMEIENLTGAPELTADQTDTLVLLREERTNMIKVRDHVAWPNWTTMAQAALDHIEKQIVDLTGRHK